MYRQSLRAAGGTAPIITSRAIPPELPAANDKTKTPNKSSLCLTPAVAPLSANTKVPAKSNPTSSVFTTTCSFTLNCSPVLTTKPGRQPPSPPHPLPWSDGLPARSADCDWSGFRQLCQTSRLSHMFHDPFHPQTRRQRENLPFSS